MDIQLWCSLGWIAGACSLGFLINAVFSGWLKLSRNYFFIFYILLVGAFLVVFSISNGINGAAILLENWMWGLLLGMLASVFLFRHVLSQPATRTKNGAKLILDIGWSGLIYGLTDALFLNVMPVLAVWVGVSQLDWAATLVGRIVVGAIGLVASLLVTLAYHLGYPEFRNRKVIMVLVGNGIITFAFLLSGNPLGSILSHPAMHIAAVLRGPETTIQLPPHY